MYRFLALFVVTSLLATACSDDANNDLPNNTEPTTGLLEITITGLPAGALAAVDVSSPAGYENTLAATTTLSDLAPGPYAITASNVVYEGVSFSAQPAHQVRTVIAGESVIATINYNPPPPRASFSLTIEGLPEALDAAVTVSGPGLFFEQVAKSTVFEDLDTGNYTVLTEEVSDAGSIFVASPGSQQVSVSSVVQGSALVSYTVERARLAVTIVGVPPTLFAHVVVTGPDGYQSAALTQSTELFNLVPGEYTVAADNITIGQLVLSAPTQTVEVISRESSEVIVNYQAPWEWVDQLSSTSFDYAYRIAIDADDNLYVAGYTASWLPNATSSGGVDGFLARYDADGERKWLKQFGTAGDDYVHGVAVGPDGNIYVAGGTNGAFEGFENAGEFDAFVARFDADGNKLWVRQIGTEKQDFGWGLAVDHLNYAFLVGQIDGIPGQTGEDGTDAFIARYDTDGEQVWMRVVDSGSRDEFNSVAIDNKGMVYVAGFTHGSFENQTSAGDFDALIARYDATGNQVWLRQFGTNAYELAYDVAVDALGAAYIVGHTYGAFAGSENQGGLDGFLARFTVEGEREWVVQFGTDANDFAQGVATDSHNNAFVVGHTAGTLEGQASRGTEDAYVLKFDRDGEQLWSRQFGTTFADQAFSTAVDSNDHVYISGTTAGDFPRFRQGGLSDAFVIKYDSERD
ncbi:MAG: SBBP repeat-containing protein [Bradymonadaceae bacterium]|nr:SBBP repeat-containing protein [Lujinxingiaceae bacterium]